MYFLLTMRQHKIIQVIGILRPWRFVADYFQVPSLQASIYSILASWTLQSVRPTERQLRQLLKRRVLRKPCLQVRCDGRPLPTTTLLLDEFQGSLGACAGALSEVRKAVGQARGATIVIEDALTVYGEICAETASPRLPHPSVRVASCQR